ncbi:histidinol-phosphatase HisJ family protein [Candidatus Latescibacterota bacterium]
MTNNIISVLPDYHIHTKLCNHAEGEMEDYVEQALKIGLKEIGFAGHMPVMPEPHLCMSYNKLPYYIEKIHEIQKTYKDRISIRLGCEMDIVHDRIGEIKNIIDEYEFDYIIGSIHYLDGWPFDQEQYKEAFEKGDLDDIYLHFFDAVISAVETGLYDIVGHVDNIKRMGFRPPDDLTYQYNRVASVIKSMNCVVELNTSGFDSACCEQYPSTEFLKILYRHGIPVTAGSDSHDPKQVGKYYERALSVLREAGYQHIVYFKGRERIMKSLPQFDNLDAVHTAQG